MTAWINDKLTALYLAKQARNEEGQTMAEYGLIIALIALVVVAAITTVGTDLTTKFEEISTELTGAGGGS